MVAYDVMVLTAFIILIQDTPKYIDTNKHVFNISIVSTML